MQLPPKPAQYASQQQHRQHHELPLLPPIQPGPALGSPPPLPSHSYQPAPQPSSQPIPAHLQSYAPQAQQQFAPARPQSYTHAQPYPQPQIIPMQSAPEYAPEQAPQVASYPPQQPSHTPKPEVAPVHESNLPYYFGMITRGRHGVCIDMLASNITDNAEDYLMSFGTEGSFLLRASESNPGLS